MYIMPPSAYQISCDICSGEVQWSEYKKMVFCPKCQLDTFGTGGFLDGPVPIQLCKILGISFDRIDLKTGKRLKMIETEDEIIWRE